MRFKVLWSKIWTYLIKGPVDVHLRTVLIIAPGLIVGWIHLSDGFSYKDFGDWIGVGYVLFTPWIAYAAFKQGIAEKR